MTRPAGPWRLVVAVVLVGLLAPACTGRTAPAASQPATATAPAPTAAADPTGTPPPASAAPSTEASATPTSAPTPAVLIAAGDISACGNDGDEATALLVEARDGTVAVLGDSVYDRGTPVEFAECYEPTWGRFKDRTRPAPGNHEYLTPGAAGYFDYFGASAGEPGLGYYSYELGAWHVVVINSQCWEVGGCGAGDAQALWLEADLRDHPAACTLAYWHVPRFSSGLRGSSTLVQAYWNLLHEAGAEIVLTGHDHSYERFAPQDAQGNPDPERGLRQFSAGTGGASHYGFPLGLPNSEVRDSTTFGVLVLTLYQDRYEWEFVPVAGKTFVDRGSGDCHG